MIQIPRLIPVLQVSDGKLVKTRAFKRPKYIGDPINAVRIFNEKEVDELALLDISASKKKAEINFSLVERVASECFMPLAYGGGITSIDEMSRLFRLGVEKVVLSSAVAKNKDLINDASRKFGAQSVVVSVDVRRNWTGGYCVTCCSGTTRVRISLENYVEQVVEAGCGEVILNSIASDGAMKGYDLELVKLIASRISVPVVALGGGCDLQSYKNVVQAGASAAAGGSMFVFQGPHRAVLIRYPDRDAIESVWQD